MGVPDHLHGQDTGHEGNHGDVDAQAYILVYSTDPVPAETSFTALRDADAPRYDEAPVVHTKELVGKRSPLRANGDIRLFADTTLAGGAAVDIVTVGGEGAVASVREGTVNMDGERLTAGTTVVMPPAAGARVVRLEAKEDARVVRVIHGSGHGFVRNANPMRRR